MKVLRYVHHSLLQLHRFKSIKNSLPTSTQLRSTSSLHSSPHYTVKSEWPAFLVEFKGFQPFLRESEFKDSSLYCIDKHQIHTSLIDFPLQTIIFDCKHKNIPLCAYVHLPNADVANQIARRCSAVRNIIEVWGDDANLAEACRQAVANYESLIKPAFSPKVLSDSVTDQSWKVSFRRQGRSGKSGLNNCEKNSMLAQFAPVLSMLPGGVNLTQPAHELVYLEDWQGYHEHTQHQLHVELRHRGRGKLCGVPDSELNVTTPEEQQPFGPSRRIFGRVVGTGPGVADLFDLQHRPYVGTTSMAPIPAHMAAVAANVGPGDRVLDPFCGTGGLLLACAYLGADVVGSDIDGECLLGHRHVHTPTPSKPRAGRSKNTNLVRKNGLNQLGWCAADNFPHYGLSERLLGLLACDVRDWLVPPDVQRQDGNYAAVTTIDQQPLSPQSFSLFDAIVTDPPYGKREKTGGSTSCGDLSVPEPSETSDGYNANDVLEVAVILFRVASRRLRPGGRLVFWLPTEAFLAEAEVTRRIQEVMAAAAASESATSNAAGRPLLRLLRVGREELNDGLWRWLCVLEHT